MALQGSDVVMSVLALVVILGLGGATYSFINAVAASTGLLTRLILSMSVPLLCIMLIMSVATAGRGDR